MLQRLFLCITLLIGSSTLIAQNLNIGVTLNAGMSKVTSNLPSSGDRKVHFTPSGTAGVFLEKRIGGKSFLGAELLWVQVEGKEVIDDFPLLTVVNGEPTVVGTIMDRTRLHSSYIGVPFYYRLELGRLGIKVGAQPLFFLFASVNSKTTGEVSGAPYESENKITDVKFDKIDIGPRFGLDYTLNSHFKLRLDYYYGLQDITSDIFPFERKNRQITMGAQYLFGQKEG